MLDLQKLKSKAEEFLLQIDDLLELFHSNQDVLLLDKIPSILTELSEVTPPDFEKAHTQIHRFSELLEIQDYDSLQDELLFFISHLDQPQSNVDIPDDSSETHSTESFSQDAILLLDDFLEEAEERLNSFEQSLINYRNEPIIIVNEAYAHLSNFALDEINATAIYNDRTKRNQYLHLLNEDKDQNTILTVDDHGDICFIRIPLHEVSSSFDRTFGM